MDSCVLKNNLLFSVGIRELGDIFRDYRPGSLTEVLTPPQMALCYVAQLLYSGIGNMVLVSWYTYIVALLMFLAIVCLPN